MIKYVHQIVFGYFGGKTSDDILKTKVTKTTDY